MASIPGIRLLDPGAARAVSVWLLDLVVEGDLSVALLTEEERTRLQRMAAPHRRRLLARRTRLAEVAADVLGAPTSSLRLAVDHGRLLVSVGGDEPLHLSTSHTGDLGVVAIADGPVGVDVESAATLVPESLDIARDLFHPDETEWIGEGAGHLDRFLAVWVRKEAVVKLTGEGLGRPLRSFVVHPSAAGPEPVTGAGDLDDVATSTLAVPGAVAAVAWRPTPHSQVERGPETLAR